MSVQLGANQCSGAITRSGTAARFEIADLRISSLRASWSRSRAACQMLAKSVVDDKSVAISGDGTQEFGVWSRGAVFEWYRVLTDIEHLGIHSMRCLPSFNRNRLCWKGGRRHSW